MSAVQVIYGLDPGQGAGAASSLVVAQVSYAGLASIIGSWPQPWYWPDRAGRWWPSPGRLRPGLRLDAVPGLNLVAVTLLVARTPTTSRTRTRPTRSCGARCLRGRLPRHGLRRPHGVRPGRDLLLRLGPGPEQRRDQRLLGQAQHQGTVKAPLAPAGLSPRYGMVTDQFGVTTGSRGELLHMSPTTVRNYLSNATAKLNARNRIDAIRIAEDAGWLQRRNPGQRILEDVETPRAHSMRRLTPEKTDGPQVGDRNGARICRAAIALDATSPSNQRQTRCPRSVIAERRHSRWRSLADNSSRSTNGSSTSESNSARSSS